MHKKDPMSLYFPRIIVARCVRMFRKINIITLHRIPAALNAKRKYCSFAAVFPTLMRIFQRMPNFKG